MEELSGTTQRNKRALEASTASDDEKSAEMPKKAKRVNWGSVVAVPPENPVPLPKVNILSVKINDGLVGSVEKPLRIAPGDVIIGGRFEVRSKLGAGTFGTVLEVKDLKVLRYVALKISNNKEGNDEGMRETGFLKQIAKVDRENKYHIVSMLEKITWNERVCFLMDAFPLNLFEYQKRFGKDGLHMSETIQVTLQLLEALNFLKNLGIIHCDLKPQNICVKDVYNLKINVIDLGSAEYKRNVTSVIFCQTRYYRSPEVILGLKMSEAIDLWSLGCIVAELHTGEVLFRGDDDMDQAHTIVKMLGMMPHDMMAKGLSTCKYFKKYNPQGTGEYYVPHGSPPRRMNPQVMTGYNPLVPILTKHSPHPSVPFRGLERRIINLIWKMLNYDPKTRITPAKAMKDPIFIMKNKVLYKYPLTSNPIREQ